MEIAKFYDAAGADYISVTGYGYGPVPMQFALDYWMYPSPDEDMKQFLDRLDGEGLSIPPAAAIKQAVSAPAGEDGEAMFQASGTVIEFPGFPSIRYGLAYGCKIGRASCRERVSSPV